MQQTHESHQENRVIGRISGREPGPTLIVIGGLHGNEPAGITAVKQVLTELNQGTCIERGQFVAIAGNLTALKLRRRFVHSDLNRGWHTSTIESPTIKGPASVEDAERRALTIMLHDALQHDGPFYVLDLHTTSGPGKPFLVFADTLRCRRFALAFPSPVILGFEEHLDGTLVDYLAGLGHMAIAFEGGQHDDPVSVTHARSAIWIALATAGLVDHGDRHASKARRVLRAAKARLPHFLEIRERHAVHEGDGFRMHPGFSTFDHVNHNQLIGADMRGAVVAPLAGLLMMPLYQEQGEDGFFIALPVRPFWIALSRLLRQAKVDRMMPWLPGVKADPDDATALVLNKRVARWLALQLVHLLGFRKIGETATELRVRRRVRDSR